MEREDLEKFKKAGRITAEARDVGKNLVKEGASVKEIINKIEEKIFSLKGKPAFPAQLSINDTAAHFIPAEDVILKEGDLVKVDVGAHVDGIIADSAVTVEVKSNKNKEMILASKEALENAIKVVRKDVEIFEIGKVIDETIRNHGFRPVTNLSGHSIEPYIVHAGLTIPNFNNNNHNKLQEGMTIAIEPFATNGVGQIFEGKASNVYKLMNVRPVRDMNARQILNFIEEEYSTLPFSKFWLISKFGLKANLALNVLEREGLIYSYPQLVEKGKGLVTQAEHSIYVGDKAIVVTKLD